MAEAASPKNPIRTADDSTAEVIGWNLLGLLDLALNGCTQPANPQQNFGGLLKSRSKEYGVFGLSFCKTTLHLMIRAKSLLTILPQDG
jgi:hypothetical protein